MFPRLHRDCTGAMAVEFALLLPVLLLMLTGILEFGRAMWIRQDMQFAVEEAARYALANDTASVTAISAKVSARLGAVGPAGVPMTVTTTVDADAITVTASADFATVIPGILPQGNAVLSARCRLPR
ncbi:MAG TPA: TadE/TadG family type IV pilus assembly protein [Magnetospirillum sp.]|nr:TadE/TadG family type IV pilus assembly protein [Magnetospirillum sp.]